MNILLTGVTGFVGTALYPVLNKNHHVYAPMHSELDLTNYRAVREYFKDRPDIDYVVHCAVAQPYYWEDTDHYSRKINADITMATNVLKFAKKSIILTSGSVYHKDEVGWIKFVISSLCNSLPNVVELRPFGIYGPGEQSQRFTTYCIRQISKGSAVVIKNNRPMSYIYIDDLCHVIDYLIANGSLKKYYDVVHPDPITMVEIAKICMSIMDKDVPIMIGEEGEPYVGKSSPLIYDMWGWKPTPHEKGLRKLYEWLV